MGSSLLGQIMDHLLGVLGLDRHVCGAHHHASNGLTEIFNQNIEKNLRCWLNEDQNWMDNLPSVIFGMNMQPLGPSGITPYLIQFGRAPNLPAHGVIPITKFPKNKSLEEYAESLAPKVARVNDIARKNFYDAQLLMKEKFDRATAPPNFAPGDEIYIDSPNRPLGHSKKLHNRFNKRFVIVSRQNYTNFIIRPKHSEHPLRYPVHCSRFNSINFKLQIFVGRAISRIISNYKYLSI